MITEEQKNEIESIVRGAGRALLEYWPAGSVKKELGAEKKSDGSIVTQADYTSDGILTTGLSKLFPEDAFFSEEGVGHTDSEAEATWIIDPLDGTKHFANGRDGFAILLGRAVRSVVEYGVCYFPVQDVYLSGQKSSDGFSNGIKLTVSDNKELQPASLYIKNTKIDNSELVYDFPGHGGLMLDKLCRGELDGIILKVTTHQEWDLSPYAPIIEAAGGRVTDQDGNEPTFHFDTPSFKYLIASNGHLHDEILGLIQ